MVHKRTTGRWAVMLAYVAVTTPSLSATAQATETPPDAGERPEATQPDSTPQAARDATASPSQDAGVIEDIIVTATRREASLQKIPVAVTALTSDELVERNISATQDLAGTVPSLRINSAFGETSPNFTLRGVGVATEYNSNSASPIAVYLDEDYQAFRFTHGQQLFDLERIEVLRGPQGTLYGRNTTGGAINFYSKTPQLAGHEGYVDLSYGNYDRVRGEGAFEYTVVPDQLGIRLSGLYGHGDGFFRAVGSNNSYSRFGSLDSVAGRAQIRYKPTDDLDFVLIGRYARDNPIGFANVAIGQCEPDSLPACVHVGEGVVGSDLFGYSRGGMKIGDANLDQQLRQPTRNNGASLKASWRLSDAATVISNTGYGWGKLTIAQDVDGSPQDAGNVIYVSKVRQFNEDMRVNVTLPRFTLTAGIYVGSDRVESDNLLRLYNVLPDPTSALDFNPGVATSFNVHQTFVQSRDSRAVYGEGTYDVTDRLALSIGLRGTWDEISYEDGRADILRDVGEGPIYIPGNPPVVLCTVCDVSLSRKSNNVSGRVIANYQWTDRILTYVSYSRGYRAGTVNGLTFATPDQIGYVPAEELTSYEGGVKSRLFDNTLQLNGSIFYYDYQNQQNTRVVDAVTFLSGIDAEVFGLEAEIIARPLSVLQLRLSAGYLDSRFVKNDKSILSGIDVGGHPLPSAPDYTLGLGGDWDVVSNGDNRLRFTLDAEYTGTYYYDAFKDFAADGPRFGAMKTEPEWVVNGRLSYTNGDWSAGLFGKNIFNNRFFVFATDLRAGFGEYFYTPNAPRTFGIEVRRTF